VSPYVKDVLIEGVWNLMLSNFVGNYEVKRKYRVRINYRRILKNHIFTNSE